MKRERGAAIVVAILIVTLAASTAAFAVWQQSAWVRQLENLAARAKADQLAISAIDVARNALRQDKDRNVDHPGDAWAQPLILPGEGAQIAGSITDQQALFNVNNLLASNKPSEPDIEAFRRLLAALKLNDELANAVLDWIDEDSLATHPGGAEDTDYLSRELPYVAANRELFDVDELARVKGFNAETLAKLKPHITALPGRTPINVNFANPLVIAAMVKGLDEEKVPKPPDGGFKNLNDFSEKIKSALPADTKLPAGAFAVNTQFFLATIRVRSARVEAGFSALLQRSDEGWPVIRWRKEAAD